MTQLTRPKPIRTDASDAFAHHTMRVRVPNIIRETQKLNPDYPAAIHEALDRLRLNIERDAPIPAIDDPIWAALYWAAPGETWLEYRMVFRGNLLLSPADRGGALA